MHLSENTADCKAAAPRPSAPWQRFVKSFLELAECEVAVGLALGALFPESPEISDRHISAAAHLLDFATLCGRVALVLDGRTRKLLTAVAQ